MWNLCFSLLQNRSRLSNDQSQEIIPDILDADDVSFLNSLEETVGDDSLSGDIYFSDEEQDVSYI